jgi:hypothetical protein
MYSTMAVANQGTMTEEVVALTHRDAVARLASNVEAMVLLDLQIERCTDPRAESCLQTLRTEHEVAYLEILYRWEYEADRTAVVHQAPGAHSTAVQTLS